MRPVILLSVVLILSVTAYLNQGFADGAIATLANIVISQQHFRSDPDKQALTAIGAGINPLPSLEVKPALASP